MSETQWKLYTSNTEAWSAMLEACENAEKSIDLEQFIFVADDFGNKLIDICARKAQQGVRVRFIWDAAGSFSFFGSGIIDDLEKKGIELIFFKTLLPSIFKVHDYKSWYFRNHRRTLVVDQRVGFTGSICIYERLKNWRDTNVRIEGPVVKDMQKAFQRMWNRAHGRKQKRVQYDSQSDYEFRYVTNNPIPRHRYLYHTVIDAIRGARKNIYVTTPYFVPTRQLARVLRLAAHRGVDVKIIIPERTDHPVVDLCARTFFNTMLKSGVKIFLYKGEMLHSKTLVVDDTWASIGTLNMDSVSLFYNFEANIVSRNHAFAAELASHFHHDLSQAEEVTLNQWRLRYWVEKCAGFFLRFIRDML